MICPVRYRFFTCFTFFFREFSSENLEFWHAVNKFKNWGNQTDEQKKSANKIWSLYLKEDAELMVNIGGEERQRVKQEVQEEKFHSRMFADAQEEILNLMRSDSFERFKKSDLWKNLLKEVGSYKSDQHTRRKTWTATQVKKMIDSRNPSNSLSQTTSKNDDQNPILNPQFTHTNSSVDRQPPKVSPRVLSTDSLKQGKVVRLTPATAAKSQPLPSLVTRTPTFQLP